MAGMFDRDKLANEMTHEARDDSRVTFEDIIYSLLGTTAEEAGRNREEWNRLVSNPSEIVNQLSNWPDPRAFTARESDTGRTDEVIGNVSNFIPGGMLHSGVVGALRSYNPKKVRGLFYHGTRSDDAVSDILRRGFAQGASAGKSVPGVSLSQDAAMSLRRFAHDRPDHLLGVNVRLRPEEIVNLSPAMYAEANYPDEWIAWKKPNYRYNEAELFIRRREGNKTLINELYDKVKDTLKDRGVKDPLSHPDLVAIDNIRNDSARLSQWDPDREVVYPTGKSRQAEFLKKLANRYDFGLPERQVLDRLEDWTFSRMELPNVTPTRLSPGETNTALRQVQASYEASSAIRDLSYRLYEKSPKETYDAMRDLKRLQKNIHSSRGNKTNLDYIIRTLDEEMPPIGSDPSNPYGFTNAFSAYAADDPRLLAKLRAFNERLGEFSRLRARVRDLGYEVANGAKEKGKTLDDLVRNTTRMRDATFAAFDDFMSTPRSMKPYSARDTEEVFSAADLKVMRDLMEADAKKALSTYSYDFDLDDFALDLPGNY